MNSITVIREVKRMQTKFNPKEKVYIVGTIEDISINSVTERYRLYVKTLNSHELLTFDVKDIFFRLLKTSTLKYSRQAIL